MKTNEDIFEESFETMLKSPTTGESVTFTGKTLEEVTKKIDAVFGTEE